MESVTQFSGKVVPLAVADVDTDQIIPARFLKTIEKLGLGKNLFHDWRYLADGGPNPDFIVNRPRAKGGTILLAGDNFGCGSSREHAPWALMGHGFKAVISTSFADIFRNNCLKNGLLPIVVDEAAHGELFAAAEADEDCRVSVDLARRTLRLPSGREVEFPIDEFSRKCMLEGGDQLSYIQQQMGAVEAYERAAPNVLNTL